MNSYTLEQTVKLLETQLSQASTEIEALKVTSIKTAILTD